MKTIYDVSVSVKDSKGNISELKCDIITEEYLDCELNIKNVNTIDSEEFIKNNMFGIEDSLKILGGIIYCLQENLNTIIHGKEDIVNLLILLTTNEDVNCQFKYSVFQVPNPPVYVIISSDNDNLEKCEAAINKEILCNNMCNSVEIFSTSSKSSKIGKDMYQVLGIENVNKEVMNQVINNVTLLNQTQFNYLGKECTDKIQKCYACNKTLFILLNCRKCQDDINELLGTWINDVYDKNIYYLSPNVLGADLKYQDIKLSNNIYGPYDTSLESLIKEE